MRKGKSDIPDDGNVLHKLSAEVLWRLSEDETIPGQVRSQVAEIARVLDDGRMRLGFFSIDK